METGLDDPRHPHVTYRRSPTGQPTPVIRGTGIRVRTIAIAVRTWSMSSATIAEEYELTEEQVADALAFSEEHREEIDGSLADEQLLEPG
jgi:uncharacterized protein (DUF433 family)